MQMEKIINRLIIGGMNGIRKICEAWIARYYLIYTCICEYYVFNSCFKVEWCLKTNDTIQHEIVDASMKGQSNCPK